MVDPALKGSTRVGPERNRFCAPCFLLQDLELLDDTVEVIGDVSRFEGEKFRCAAHRIESEVEKGEVPQPVVIARGLLGEPGSDMRGLLGIEGAHLSDGPALVPGALGGRWVLRIAFHGIGVGQKYY